MKLTLIALTAFATCSGAIGEKFNAAPIANYINQLPKATWTAGVNHYFENAPMSGVRKMMGVWMEGEKRKQQSMTVEMNEDIPASSIPATFDGRQAWPMCADVIDHIRDQSACGSCWAVGAAGAISDRICVASKGEDKTYVAGADLMSCCWLCGMGCSGGYPSEAWAWWTTSGLCTGGDNGSKQGCKPYPFPMCEHHINGTHHPPCPTADYDTPRCKRSCTNEGYGTEYADDKHKGSRTYKVYGGVETIQKEIMTYGSVEAAFSVYKDFLTYKKGVYKHETGGYLGGHAVRMIGWGEENGTPYWLIANSWNSDWGDKGYFKILRGQDECGVESGIVAGRV